MLLATPIGAAAQQPFSNSALEKRYIINGSKIKTNQQTENDVQYWLNAGVGVGTLGVALNISINYKIGKKFIYIAYFHRLL